jgi:hypothetical protein
MNAREQMFLLAAICLVVVLLSAAGLLWAIFFGQLFTDPTVDVLLLAIVCLLMGGVFSLQLGSMLKATGRFKLPKFSRSKAPAEAPANPSAAEPK